MNEFGRLIDDWWSFTNVLVELFLVAMLLKLLVAVDAECNHAGDCVAGEVVIKSSGQRVLERIGIGIVKQSGRLQFT